MKDEENGGRRGNDLAERLKQFALRSIKVFAALPKTDEARVLGKQFLRSATSVGAHYRQARRPNPTPISSARSKERFRSSMKLIIG
jgi:four helix bundle protein